MEEQRLSSLTYQLSKSTIQSYGDESQIRLDAGTANTELYLNITFLSMQRSPTYSVPLKFYGQKKFFLRNL